MRKGSIFTGGWTTPGSLRIVVGSRETIRGLSKQVDGSLVEVTLQDSSLQCFSYLVEQGIWKKK